MDDVIAFDRSLFKRNAKVNLKGKYGSAVLIVFLAQIFSQFLVRMTTYISGFFTTINTLNVGLLFDVSDVNLSDILYDVFRELYELFYANRLLFIILILVNAVVTVCSALLIGNLIRIGMKRWFLRTSNPHQNATTIMAPLFSSYRYGRFLSTFRGTAWKSLWLIVWSLPVIVLNILFIVPALQLIDTLVRIGSDLSTFDLLERTQLTYGLPSFFYSPAFFIVVGIVIFVLSIVLLFKSYQYKMTDYILADNPFIGARRALTISKQMSKGSLWRFFVIDLSFAGWFLLAVMCICLAGIGVLFLLPYHEATWVEVYKNRRDNMVARRELSMEELGYVRQLTGDNG
ncbi:MAG TPA: DUF975 family protein [Clostridiaceae bacterium]|jgi:uncharacterized membrane protein|nr:DUF975 family protein [Clostridiaceae bacterium]